MKKTLLFFALFLQATFLLAQGSLQLFDHDDNEFINGQNHDVTVDFANWENVSPELFVKNNSANALSVKIRVEVVYLPESTSSYFCGLGNCFAPGVTVTPNAFPLAAGELIGNAGVFSAHYQANNVEDDAVMRYTFFNIDDVNDTISVTFTFDGTPEVSGPSLQLFDHDNVEFVNGQNHDVMVDPAEWETVSPELFVKNMSDDDVSIKIRVEEVSVIEGSSNYFCGLGNCFAPGVTETPNPWLLGAGQLIGNEGVFSAHYQANGSEGNSIVRYTFFNIDDQTDTISVTFTFVATPTVSESSMKLYDHDNVEFVNGQNYTVNVDTAAWENVSPELFVKNISEDNIDIKIRAEEISVPEGSANYFCGLGNCFAPGVMETPHAYTVAAGQLIGNEGVFSSHYQANGVAGSAQVRYTFFNTVDLNDTISVTFTFDNLDGVNNLYSEHKFDTYPNPSQGIVNVRLSDFDVQEGTFEVYNSLGKLAFTQSFKGESILVINLDNLPKGVYLTRIVSKGSFSSASKLILK